MTKVSKDTNLIFGSNKASMSSNTQSKEYSLSSINGNSSINIDQDERKDFRKIASNIAPVSSLNDYKFDRIQNREKQMLK